MVSDARLKELKEEAYKIRRHVLEMTTEAGSGHPGGSLSCVDVITALYFHVLRHNPEDPYWKERDRFVLSKGHAAPTLYAALAESGYFDPSKLKDLRKIGDPLQGHPDRNRLPGVENSSGSLGNGLAQANGMALAGKIDDSDYQVYCLVGDGECDEGLIWESAMLSSHYKLDNLTAIVDRNGLQIDGPTERVMSIEPIAAKWKSFGWEVLEVNGHDLDQIIGALESAKQTKGKPTVVIAHLIKGKGVASKEWVTSFHGKPLSKEECEKALKELDSWYKKEVGE